MKSLRRFWFKFPGSYATNPSPLGCGVTAYTYEDAIYILKQTIFVDREFLGVESCIEDVDLSSLDEKHIMPNIEPPIWRGVWFPKGFMGQQS